MTAAAVTRRGWPLDRERLKCCQIPHSRHETSEGLPTPSFVKPSNWKLLNVDGGDNWWHYQREWKAVNTLNVEKPQVTILCCVRKDRGRGGNRWLESRTNSVPANEARLEIGICVFWVTATMLQPATNYNCPKHFPSTTTLQSTSASS